MLSVTSFNAVDMKTKSVISISQHHCLIFVWVWYHTIHTKPMVSFEKTKMALKSRFYISLDHYPNHKSAHRQRKH